VGFVPGPWLSLKTKFHSLVLTLTLRVKSLVLALALRLVFLLTSLLFDDSSYDDIGGFKGANEAMPPAETWPPTSAWRGHLALVECKKNF